MQTDTEALTPYQVAFIHEYDSNGGNGTRAYLASHPHCARISAAAACASRLLRTAKVKNEIDALAAARWRRLQMTGDEAAMLVASDARADIRELFDEHNNVLPPHLWPDSIARSVKACSPCGPRLAARAEPAGIATVSAATNAAVRRAQTISRSCRHPPFARSHSFE